MKRTVDQAFEILTEFRDKKKKQDQDELNCVITSYEIDLDRKIQSSEKGYHFFRKYERRGDNDKTFEFWEPILIDRGLFCRLYRNGFFVSWDKTKFEELQKDKDLAGKEGKDMNYRFLRRDGYEEVYDRDDR